MPLTIRTIPEGDGNSYNSLAELDTELVDTRHETAWEVETDTRLKESAAIRAKDYLDARYRIREDCLIGKVKLAHALLSSYALAGSLVLEPESSETDTGQVVSESKSVGSLSKSVTYARTKRSEAGASGLYRRFPIIDGILAGCQSAIGGRGMVAVLPLVECGREVWR